MDIEAIRSVKGTNAEIDFLISAMKDSRYNTTSEGFLHEGEKLLQKAFEEYLNLETKVSIKSIGQGCYGNAFKIECLDKSNNKIMQDRVIKIYKTLQQNQQLYTEKIATIQKIWEKNEKKLTDETRKIIKTTEEQAKKIVNHYKECFFNREKIRGEVLSTKEMYEQQKSYHGCPAEANSAMRLNHILGHKPGKDNIIAYDMFDLENGFALELFSSASLPKVTKKIDFEKLGLSADELLDNCVNGRIIDYGGLCMKIPELQDKAILKYYKKIMNRANEEQSLEYIKYLRGLLTQNPKFPSGDKIEKAIALAEEMIVTNKSSLKLEDIIKKHANAWVENKNKNIPFYKLEEKAVKTDTTVQQTGIFYAVLEKIKNLLNI